MAKRVNYNQVAPVYDRRYRNGGPTGIAECLLELAGSANASRVLEVGCGSGYWLSLLHSCDLRCGLDASPGMLEIARERDSSLKLIRGTAAKLPFRRHTFRLLYCVHALHHFEEPESFFAEAFRLLGQGGVLVVIGMDPHTKKDEWYLYDYFPGTYETDLRRYPAGARILGWMETAGFVRCERRLAARIDHEFIGEEVFNDPILHKEGTSQLSLLTGEAFEEGMERMKEALRLAERRGEDIVFSTHIALPVVIGYAPEAA
jgi:SAM-dependent methyltransferase